MCGVFGYIGNKDPLEVCLLGLEQLEYRGYDSTGIAGIANGQLAICKKAGKLSNLKKTLSPQKFDLAIAHTRWATHGKVNDANAHPHSNESIALIHNGIIENYAALREMLQNEGVAFTSETDTEVIVHLISKFFAGDLLTAVQTALKQLKGLFAIAVIHKDHPDQIIAAARECPLSIATDDAATESIITSDPNAFFGSVLNVRFLRNNEVARVRKGKVDVFNQEGILLDKPSIRLNSQLKPPSKEGFEHFMLKEIFEQPTTIQKAIQGRFENGDVLFEGLPISDEEFRDVRQIWILGCGTSANAGSIGSFFLEDLAKIPTHCEISSEARYRIPIISPDTLILAISQSGETADTIAAVREVKAHGCKVLSICNVQNSTLTRESDAAIYLNAGPEMSVCSTKAFTSQISVLALFALKMARLKGLSREKANQFMTEFHKLPSQIQTILDLAPQIEKISQKYSHYNDFFFMGRRYMFPTALEAALKLKEISYVNANAYPAGELKHGPIALLDANFPVIAFTANHLTQEKMISNLMEVKARGAPVLAFAPKGLTAPTQIADDIIWLPPAIDELSPFASSVASQLFAYYFAKFRGCDIDQPRNLAKSVTVE